MAEGQKALGAEIPVRELIAEKDADERGDAENTPHQPLLPGAEVQHAHVGEDFDLPSPPDSDLEDHHEEELEFNGLAGGVAHKRRRG